MKNAETGTPISYSRAKEMVTYCWNDDVSHPGNGFRHFTHTQVHISDDCWTDNKQLKIVAHGAKIRRRFQADSGYMPLSLVFCHQLGYRCLLMIPALTLLPDPAQDDSPSPK